MNLALVKTQKYTLEIRDRGSDGYLLIIRGDYGYLRTIAAPKMLRSGRSGLAEAIELLQDEIEGLW